MPEMIKTIDPWFLNMAVFVLATYFTWSVKGLFKDLKESIADLKNLIKDLYEHRNHHETRLTTLETRCTLHHGDATMERQGHGRKFDVESTRG